jgi:AbrB family looped-hinge helix DNA binding protein
MYYKNAIDGWCMTTVTVSPKFQVVIPREIRESVGLKVGEILQVIQYGRRIEMIPVKTIKSLKGFIKGMNTTFTRDEDRV